MNDMRLQVILSAVDKLTAHFVAAALPPAEN